MEESKEILTLECDASLLDYYDVTEVQVTEKPPPAFFGQSHAWFRFTPFLRDDSGILYAKNLIPVSRQSTTTARSTNQDTVNSVVKNIKTTEGGPPEQEDNDLEMSSIIVEEDLDITLPSATDAFWQEAKDDNATDAFLPEAKDDNATDAFWQEAKDDKNNDSDEYDVEYEDVELRGEDEEGIFDSASSTKRATYQRTSSREIITAGAALGVADVDDPLDVTLPTALPTATDLPIDMDVEVEDGEGMSIPMATDLDTDFALQQLEDELEGVDGGEYDGELVHVLDHTPAHHAKAQGNAPCFHGTTSTCSTISRTTTRVSPCTMTHSATSSASSAWAAASGGSGGHRPGSGGNTTRSSASHRLSKKWEKPIWSFFDSKKTEKRVLTSTSTPKATTSSLSSRAVVVLPPPPPLSPKRPNSDPEFRPEGRREEVRREEVRREEPLHTEESSFVAADVEHEEDFRRSIDKLNPFLKEATPADTSSTDRVITTCSTLIHPPRALLFSKVPGETTTTIHQQGEQREQYDGRESTEQQERGERTSTSRSTSSDINTIDGKNYMKNYQEQASRTLTSSFLGQHSVSKKTAPPLWPQLSLPLSAVTRTDVDRSRSPKGNGCATSTTASGGESRVLPPPPREASPQSCSSASQHTSRHLIKFFNPPKLLNVPSTPVGGAGLSTPSNTSSSKTSTSNSLGLGFQSGSGTTSASCNLDAGSLLDSSSFRNAVATLRQGATTTSSCSTQEDVVVGGFSDRSSTARFLPYNYDNTSCSTRNNTNYKDTSADGANNNNIMKNPLGLQKMMNHYNHTTSSSTTSINRNLQDSKRVEDKNIMKPFAGYFNFNNYANRRVSDSTPPSRVGATVASRPAVLPPPAKRVKTDAVKHVVANSSSF
ncbi:unnamed protein product [Amoebophrya sp. A25]|nr:unnamed protein product [Amoebophrya sp. A25]|eukprot:GSA25T00008840001.1